MASHQAFSAGQKSSIASRDGRKLIFGLAFLFLGLVVLLVPGLSNPFYLDDLPRIVDNPDLRSWTNLWTRLIFKPSQTALTFGNDPSRPLVFLLYGFVYQNFGPSPAAFRALNIVLHIINTILLLQWLRQINFGQNKQISVVGLLLAVTFFCLAPIQIGTVVYAYALSDVLVTTWLLLFLWVGTSVSGVFIRAAILTVVLLLGLATKQVAAVFPLVLLAQGIMLDQTAAQRRRRFIIFFWLFCLVAAYVLGRQFYFGSIGDLEGRGEVKNIWSYLVFQPYVIWRYVGLSFFPFGLSIDHAPDLNEISFMQWCLAYGFLLGLLITPVVLLRLKASTRSRLVMFLAIAFVVLLAPTSSFLPTVDYMVERRVYMANFAIAALLCLIVEVLTPYLSAWQKHVGCVFIIALISLFAVINWQRIRLFADPVAMWSDVRRLYPESARARRALGMIFFDKKDFDAALQQLLPLTLGHDYMSVVTVGSIYADLTHPLHNAEIALQYYNRAQSLQPAMALAYFAKAKLLQNLKRESEAEAQFLQALAIDPRHSDAYNNLGNIYFTSGRYNEAIAAFQRAWEFAAPIMPAALAQDASIKEAQDARIPMANLATTFASMGRYDDALAVCQQALAQLPDETTFMGILGYLYGQKQWQFYDESRALEYLRKAALGGRDQNALFNLARKLHALGELGQAQQIYLDLIKMAPEDIDVRKNLALLEWQLGHHERASLVLEAAIKLAPTRQDLKRLFESLQSSSPPQ